MDHDANTLHATTDQQIHPTYDSGKISASISLLYIELREIGRHLLAMFGLSVDFFSMGTTKPVVNNVGSHALVA